MATRSLVDRLRNEAYTGADRCLPCTVVNLALVAIAAGLVWLLSPIAAGLVGLVGVAATWLRGYVVPGTPQLTRRYLPASVLAVFGKEPAGSTTVPPDGDPAEKLVALGVIADREDDPALASSFRTAWSEAAGTLADDPAALREAAAAAVADTVDPADVTVEESEADGATLTVDGSWVGQWPSRTALVADLATERTLAGPAWSSLDRRERVDLAARIRGLTEQCPTCDGPTRVSDETVRSCCHTTDVVAVSCADCAERLAEFDPSPSTFAAGR
jgi:hypothetical protein